MPENAALVVLIGGANFANVTRRQFEQRQVFLVQESPSDPPKTGGFLRLYIPDGSAAVFLVSNQTASPVHVAVRDQLSAAQRVRPGQSVLLASDGSEVIPTAAGQTRIDETSLDHNLMSNLGEGNPHPQYAMLDDLSAALASIPRVEAPEPLTDAETLGGRTPDYYLNRDNHRGTVSPLSISPQGENSGLDADTLRGLSPDDFVSAGEFRELLSRMTTAARWNAGFSGTFVAHTLDSHTDVLVEGVTDGQALVYRASDQKWVPGAGGGGGGDASTLNGQPGSYYLDEANHTGIVPRSRGGTGSDLSSGTGFYRAGSGGISALIAETGTEDVVRNEDPFIYRPKIEDYLQMDGVGSAPSAPSNGSQQVRIFQLGVGTAPRLQLVDTTGAKSLTRDLEHGDLWYGRNETGSTITAGSVVAVTSESTNFPLIALADASTVGLEARGVAMADIANNSQGRIVSLGRTLDVIDTSSLSVGDQLYLSTTPGEFTNVAPTHPDAIQKLGRVVTVSSTGVVDLFIEQSDEGGAAGLDSTYLRLDTTNDPLTGDLDLGGNNVENIGQVIGSGLIPGFLLLSPESDATVGAGEIRGTVFDPFFTTNNSGIWLGATMLSQGGTTYSFDGATGTPFMFGLIVGTDSLPRSRVELTNTGSTGVELEAFLYQHRQTYQATGGTDEEGTFAILVDEPHFYASGAGSSLDVTYTGGSIAPHFEADSGATGSGNVVGYQAGVFNLDSGWTLATRTGFTFLLADDSGGGTITDEVAFRVDGFVASGSRLSFLSTDATGEMHHVGDAIFGADATPGAKLEVRGDDATQITFVSRAVAAQTAALQQWQDSGGTSLLSVLASGVLDSDVTTGTAPFNVDSATLVTNLNADLLDGQHAVAFQSADPDLAAIAALTDTGFAARTAADTWALRSLTQPAAGLTITNPAGVAGNPTFALANDLSALEALGSTGIAVRTAADTWAQRAIVAGSSKISVANGDGVAANPSIDVVEANLTHNNLGGLTTGDPHTQYTLLAGRSGTSNDTILSSTATGSIYGSAASGGSLRLLSTSHATKGKIEFGASGTHVFDAVNQRLGLGIANPTSKLHIIDSITATSGFPNTIGISSTYTPGSASSAQVVGVDMFLGIAGSVDPNQTIAIRGLMTHGNSATGGTGSLMRGLSFQAIHGGIGVDTTGMVEEVGGAFVQAFDRSTNTTTMPSLYGGSFIAQSGPGGSVTKTITDMTGVLSRLLVTKSTVTVTTGRAFWARLAPFFSAGTFTNAYGVHVEAWPTQYSYTNPPEQIHLDAMTVASSVAIRQLGTTPHSRFQGAVAFGVDSAPSHGIDVQTSLGFKRTTVANANYNVLTSDLIVSLTSLSASNKTFTLPAASTAGARKIYFFKNETSGSGFSLIIARSGADLIDGATSKTLGDLGSTMLYCTGSAWFSL